MNKITVENLLAIDTIFKCEGGRDKVEACCLSPENCFMCTINRSKVDLTVYGDMSVPFQKLLYKEIDPKEHQKSYVLLPFTEATVGHMERHILRALTWVKTDKYMPVILLGRHRMLLSSIFSRRKSSIAQPTYDFDHDITKSGPTAGHMEAARVLSISQVNEFMLIPEVTGMNSRYNLYHYKKRGA